MTDKLPDVWTSRDYPVLREVTRRIDSGEDLMPTADAVAEATGLTLDEVSLAGEALQRRGYVTVGGEMGNYIGWFEQVSGAAYLITGLHPDGDEALSALISALRQAADETGDEDERGRLRKAADALGGIGRDIGAGVLTAVLTKYAGAG